MSWSISELVNTVAISDKVARQIYKATSSKFEGKTYNDTFDDVKDVTRGGKLYFNCDHDEHMDYLAHTREIITILCAAKCAGDICFGSLEGDNANTFWGYRFDGKGNVALLEGDIHWEIKR